MIGPRIERGFGPGIGPGISLGIGSVVVPDARASQEVSGEPNNAYQITTQYGMNIAEITEDCTT